MYPSILINHLSKTKSTFFFTLHCDAPCIQERKGNGCKTKLLPSHLCSETIKEQIRYG